MALDSAVLDNLLRSNQVLADADSLLAGTAGLGGSGSTSTASSALGSLGALDLTDVGSGPVNDVTNIANQGVLNFHAALEALADANGLLGTVHGVTNLGEDTGLGHIGQNGNVLTDLLRVPSDIAAGNPGAAGSAIPDALSLQTALHGLIQGVGYDSGVNTQPFGAIPSVSQLLPGTATVPAANLVNEVTSAVAGLGEHALENGGLPDAAQAVAGLDAALFGQSGLVHDLLAAPGQLLAGNTSILSELPADLENVVGSVQGVVSGVLADLGHGGALANPLGVVTGALGDVTSANGDQLLNDVVQNVHATLESVADPILPATVHGVTGLGNAIGLGELGGSNLLTDVLNTPGALASGNLAPVEHLPSDVSSVLAGVGNLANGVGSDIAASPVLGGLEHLATGSGLLGGALPGQGVLGEVTSLTGGVVPGGSAGGLTGTLDGLTGGLTGGSGHGLLDTVTSTLGGATGGGGLGNLGGTLGGLTGGLTGGNGGSGSGSHDVVTVAAGPQTPSSGVQLDLLSNGQDGSTHVVDSHVGTASAATPTVANVGLLSGGSLQFPPSSNGGDSLSGLGGSMSSPPAHDSSGSTPPAASSSAPPMESEPASHQPEHAGGSPHADWFTPSAHAGHG